MANTYTWAITKIECIPSGTGVLPPVPPTNPPTLTNIVEKVYWTLTGTDGTHTAVLSGQTKLTYMAGNPFVQYSSLTQAQVLEWVQSYIGNAISDMEKNLDAQIANLASPTIITQALPWGA